MDRVVCRMCSVVATDEVKRISLQRTWSWETLLQEMALRLDGMRIDQVSGVAWSGGRLPFALVCA